MMIALVIVGGLVGLLAVMAAFGATLRADHQAARAIALPRSADAIFAIVRDVEGAVRWRTDLERVEVRPPVDGKRAYREHGRHRAIDFVIDEDTAPSGIAAGRLVTRIADDSLPFGGRWIYVVARAGDHCRLTITEDGIVKNPLFRFLARTVFSPTATLDRTLRALAAHLGAPATPEPADPIL